MLEEWAGIPVVEHLTGLGQLLPQGGSVHRGTATSGQVRHVPRACLRSTALTFGPALLTSLEGPH